MSYLPRSIHCILVALGTLQITSLSRADNAIAAQPPLDVAAPVVPAPVTTTTDPGATPAPSAVAPEPAPPPPPVPRSSIPDAKPIDSLGDAHWSDSIGFVQVGDGKQTSDRANDKPAPSAPNVRDATLNVSVFRFGVNRLTLNPINDGHSSDQTAIGVLELPIDFRFEWRRGGSLFVPWLDFGTAFWLGERTVETPSGQETNMTLGMTGFRFGARFGMDVQPVQYVGIGPLIGARIDLYRASLEQESSTTPSEAEYSPDAGLQYGLHARVRTRARPGTPSVFYFDPALVWKSGAYQTGQYGSVELGVRAGSMYLIGQYERRLSASGKFTYGSTGDVDAATLSEAYAAAMPAEQRLGLALAVIMAGKD